MDESEKNIKNNRPENVVQVIMQKMRSTLAKLSVFNNGIATEYLSVANGINNDVKETNIDKTPISAGLYNLVITGIDSTPTIFPIALPLARINILLNIEFSFTGLIFINF